MQAPSYDDNEQPSPDFTDFEACLFDDWLEDETEQWSDYERYRFQELMQLL